MSNRKKKKTPPKPPCSLSISKTYFDEFSVTARKVLQLLELDPALYDKFTKKQKLSMMLLRFIPAHVYPMTGHSVPKVYVKVLQQEAYKFLKEIQVGEPSLGLSFYDYVTYGMTFISAARCREQEYAETPVGPICSEIAKRYTDNNNNFDISYMRSFYQYMHLITFFLSKINMRYYGFNCTWEKVRNSNRWACHVFISANEAERVHFTYKKMLRPAYRLAMGSFLSKEPNWIMIPYTDLYPDSKIDKLLNVYVQNHVIARMKQRLDNQVSTYHNIALVNSMFNKEMVKCENGQSFLACRDHNELLVGYFPFIIIDENLYILTFLPLSSPDVPEGKKMCESLRANKDDLIFLGMDKLSFYSETDFDAIPQLKTALKDAGMWHLTEIESDDRTSADSFEKRIGLMAKFFQQNAPEPNKEEVFDEIEKMY